MSLINQMLRDLEKRRETDSGSLSAGEQPAAVGSTLPKRRLLWLITVGFMLFTVVWIAGAMVPGRQSSPIVELVSPVEKKIIPVNAPLTPVAGAVVHLRDKAGEQITPEQPIGEDPVQVKTFKFLNLDVLETGKSARLMLEFDRLPDFEIAENNENSNHLSVFLAKVAHEPLPMLSQIEGALVKNIKLEPQDSDLWVSVELSCPIRVKSLVLPADSFHGQRLLIELTEVSRPSSAEIAAAEAAKSRVVSHEKVVSTQRVKKVSQTLSSEHQAKMAYVKGLEELQSGDQMAAESSLQRALLLHPAFLAARLQLADLLQGRSNRQAKELLLTGLSQQPGHAGLRKRLARVLITESKPVPALDLLQKSPVPAVNEDQEYHALLAAVLQETGQYAAAAESYASLLRVNSRQPLWWLGRGIALEQSGKPNQARDAYRRALALQGLRQDLQDYVRGRLQAL